MNENSPNAEAAAVATSPSASAPLRPSASTAGGGRNAAAAAVPVAVLALLLASAALILGVVMLHRSDEAARRLDQVHEDDLLRDQRNSQRELRLGALERQWMQAQDDGDIASTGGTTVIASADLRRRREQLALLDIERLVEEVQLQLRLGAAPAVAIEALSAADARLSRLASPVAVRVQAALRHDLARLRAAPDTDRGAMVARLDPLFAAVDHWHPSADPTHPSARAPIAPDAAPAPAPSAATASAAPPAPALAVTAAAASSASSAEAAEPTRGARLRAWLAREFGDFLRFREIDTPDALLLAPAQQQLLRDRFRLGVLDLREAILARDERTVRAEAGALDALLARYFDPNDPGVAAAQAQLRAAAAAAVPAAAMSLDETLAALRAAHAGEG
jgi:uncharacterized protein HemX